ncbi:MAG: CPBP family intramembrane metalloprotease [Calditrichaeota bacterium]|nr:MAG: CPBP family intramembrane metalloprotease [Calditrichota bacterium]
MEAVTGGTSPAKSDELKSTRPLIKMGWARALLYLFASIVATLLFAVISSYFVFNFTGISAAAMPAGEGNLAKFIGPYREALRRGLPFLGVVLVTWLFRKYIDKKSMLSLGFELKNYKWDLSNGLVWGFGTISCGFLFLYLTEQITVVNINFDPVLLFGYLLTLIIAAVNEEIMMRGYILKNLFCSMNRYVALVVSSIFFGLLHLGNANVTLLSFINISLAGIFLGIYYLHKQNLWFPIGLHLTWNFFQGPVWGFEVSGSQVQGVFTLVRHGGDLWTGGVFGFEASILATIILICSTVILHFQYKQTRNTNAEAEVV